MSDDSGRPAGGDRPGGLDLTARPGQRRAVRLIALALALLAVGLGVRGATTDDAAPARGERHEQRDEPEDEREVG